MRQTSYRQLAILIGVILLLLVFRVFAQDDGLLTNGGFEEPYLTLDGEPLREVASGWTPWHVEDSGSPRWRNRQPTYQLAKGEELIVEGLVTQLISSYYETHDGGLFQVIEEGITAGMNLEFSAYAHVWSNAIEDRSQSEHDGDVFVQIGVDPTGGSDPASENIIWSVLTERYDEYQRHSVKVMTTREKVTVFLRSIVLKPQAYSQVRWDHARLRILNRTLPSPSTTLVPHSKHHHKPASPSSDG